MQNSVAKKIFAVGVAASTVLMSLAPFAAHAAAHALGTNIKSQDGTVWTITTENNATVRRPYTSGGAFISYGFNSWGSVVDANADDLALTAGSFIPPQDGKIICSDRGSDKGTCYLITGGQKAGFTSAAVFTGLGFSFARAGFGDVSWMTSTSNIDNTTAAHRAGVLVNKAGTVYLVGANGLLGIPSPETFNTWGYSFADVVTANAADAAMTQTGVMAARQPGQFSPSAIANLPSSGSVTVALASDSPAASTLVAGQTGADLAHFAFSGTGSVTQVVLNRIGVSGDSAISSVYLYQGNNRITDAGSLSNGRVTFGNTAGLFNVNGTANLSVRADVGSDVSGQTVGFQLASYTVANATPASVSVSGNLMSVANVGTDLATVTLNGSVTGTTAEGGSVQAGTSNAILYSLPISVGKRSVLFKYVSFKQIGSAPATALQNLKLFVDGSQAGSTTSITNNGANTNVAVFDLSASPVTLTTGPHTIELHGDVMSGSSYSYDFTMQQAADVVFYDTAYNVNVALMNGSVQASNLIAPSSKISAGQVSVQADPNFTATQFVANQAQTTLGQWTMKAYGEDVKVQSLQVVLSYFDNAGAATSTAAGEGFNNLTLYVNGGSVGSSQNSTAANTIATSTFGITNLFTIPAGQTVTIAVKGDSVLSNPTKVSSVSSSLVTPAKSMEGLASYTFFPTDATPYTGATLSAGNSTAALAANAAFQSQNMAANTLKQKIGSYVIQAGSVDGVRVNQLTVAFATGQTMPLTSLSNLYLVTPDMPNGTSPVNPNSSNTFAVNFTVPANNTAQVDVYADLGSVSAGTQTVITSMSGTGIGSSSNQSVTLASAPGQTLTVGAGALGSVILNTSASPVSQFVVGGSTNQPAATYTFTASSTGGATIQELGFTDAKGAVTSVTVGGKTAIMVGGKALVTGLSLAVPTGNAGLDVPVTVNYAPVGNGGIAPTSTQMALGHVKYLSGSKTVTDGLALFGDATHTLVGASGVAANSMFVAGTAPSVAISGASTFLSTGSPIVGSVTVTANAAGRLTLKALPVKFSTSTGVTLGTTGAVTVYDHATGNIAGTGNLSAGAGTISLDNYNSISAGASQTYDIAVSATVSGASQSLALGLGDSGAFTFTDVNGGVDLTGRIPASGGVNYIANYPTTQVSIHN